MLPFEILPLLCPFLAQPFQPLVLLHELSNSIVPALALCPLHEAVSISYCLDEGLQCLLALLVEGKYAFNEFTPFGSQG